jgi:competence ComEA-like helix-hairpin-helix protein
MLKKLLMLFVALSLSLAAGLAAAVEVNTADQAALEAVKGLGPVKSKAIIDERTKNGPFKDADDLANRVKGLGTKSVGHLEENGLTIGGSSTPPKGVKLSKPAATPSAAPARPRRPRRRRARPPARRRPRPRPPRARPTRRPSRRRASVRRRRTRRQQQPRRRPMQARAPWPQRRPRKRPRVRRRRARRTRPPPPPRRRAPDMRRVRAAFVQRAPSYGALFSEGEESWVSSTSSAV